MKHREDRQKVMVRARMRSGASWHDVCILNLSPHGAGIQAAHPPERGAYVEIRRGKQIIVARVVWTKGHRAGLRAQDVIFIPAFLSDADGSASPPTAVSAGHFVERRRAPRSASRSFEHSRLLARAAQFAGLVLFGGGAAYMAFGAVEQALARPLSQISAALHAS